MALEQLISGDCPNCKKEHNAKFFSLFVDELHYLIGDCTGCGYRMEFPLHEFGGGIFVNGKLDIESLRSRSINHDLLLSRSR